MRLTALGREKLDVSRYCGMTLSNLACHRQNRVPVVQAGGLKPLCDMAFDGERLEMQRAAGLALYNLSCAAANQVSCCCRYGCYRIDENGKNLGAVRFPSYRVVDRDGCGSDRDCQGDQRV